MTTVIETPPSLDLPSYMSSFGLTLMSSILGRRGLESCFSSWLPEVVSECWPSSPRSCTYVTEFHTQRTWHTGTSVYLSFPLQLSIFKGLVCIPGSGWRGPSPCWRDGVSSVSDVPGGLSVQGVIGSFIIPTIPVFRRTNVLGSLHNRNYYLGWLEDLVGAMSVLLDLLLLLLPTKGLPLF